MTGFDPKAALERQISDLLNRDKFAEYLKTLPQTEVFAQARDPNACPVARFLQAQGHLQAAVHGDAFWLHYQNDSPAYLTPEWVAAFVENINWHGLTVGNALTPEQALSALAECEAGQ